jgi:hypothetical protein
MERNPIDIVRQQREADYEEERRFEDEFIQDKIGRSLVFFHHTSQKFIEHLKENDYPYGLLTNFHGQEYVEYPLYSTTSNGEGETFFQGSPLSLLIDANENVSYKYATGFIGLYRLDDSARFFTVPATVDEYQATIKDRLPIPNSRDGSDLLNWSAYLLEQMSRFTSADPVRNARPHDTHIYRHEEYKKIITFLFPDGVNIHQRRQYLAAQQTQQ